MAEGDIVPTFCLEFFLYTMSVEWYFVNYGHKCSQKAKISIPENLDFYIIQRGESGGEDMPHTLLWCEVALSPHSHLLFLNFLEGWPVSPQGQQSVHLHFVLCFQFPYCDGSHNQHNKETGDNVGPVVIKRANPSS